METILQHVKKFLNDEEGVTALEYGLISALIAVMIIAGATIVGTSLNTTFINIGGIIAAAV